jgi:flavin reductase (DIM6/NTAB) family NADH-FMN oxidoreductase RutF
MPSTVTLWTAYGREARPAGLTVASTVVAEGEPGALLGLVDDESDLYAALLASNRCAVTVLAEGDGQLADRFAGLLPAPGGLFAEGVWERTEYGPVRSRRHPWVGCTVASSHRVGYAVLVEATVERIELGADDVPPLLRHRGHYTRALR